VDIRAVYARQLATRGPAGRVFAAASVDGGGVVRARGTLDVGGRTGRGEVRVRDLAIAGLAANRTGRVRIEQGTVGGQLAVEGPPFTLGPGRVSLDGLRAVAGQDDPTEPVVSWQRLRAGVRRVGLDPLALDLERLAVSEPYLVLRIDPDGLYPVHLARDPGTPAETGPPPDGGSDDAAGAPAEAPEGPTVSIASVEVEDGTVFFEDRTIEPRYKGTLAEIAARLRALTVPPFGVESVTVNALVNERATLAVTGHVRTDDVRLRSELKRLALVPLNAYLGRAAGYRARKGSASLTTDLKLARHALEAANRLVLNDLRLSKTGEQDVIGNLIGMPLTLAVALMKDHRGRISLDLPVQGDPAAPDFALRDVVLTALRAAILGATLSPLKLLGSVLVERGDAKALEIAPVSFAPGSATLDHRGERRFDRLAAVLSQHPALAATLRGRTGPADVEALQDRAVLEHLENDPRAAAILETLRIRQGDLAGPPRPLEAADAERLAALRAGTTIAADTLETLARARVAHAIAYLGRRHTVPADRLTAADPASAGPPAVLVELGG
jgi:hypothetical protein